MNRLRRRLRFARGGIAAVASQRALRFEREQRLLVRIVSDADWTMRASLLVSLLYVMQPGTPGSLLLAKLSDADLEKIESLAEAAHSAADESRAEACEGGQAVPTCSVGTPPSPMPTGGRREH